MLIAVCRIAIPCKDADLVYWKMKVNLITLENKNERKITK